MRAFLWAVKTYGRHPAIGFQTRDSADPCDHELPD